jgi:hypothetical protein
MGSFKKLADADKSKEYPGLNGKKTSGIRIELAGWFRGKGGKIQRVLRLKYDAMKVRY